MELLVFFGVIIIIVVLVKVAQSNLSEVLPEDTLFNNGNSYAERGEYDQAISNYTAALKINPRHSKVLIHRGDTYMRKGEYDKAIADYNTVLEISPHDVVANIAGLTNRGKAYMEKGEYDKAIADYNASLKIYPSNIVALEELKIAYKKKKSEKR